MRMAPPGRASNSHTGLVNPCGPHHSRTHFGSVHALNTSSLGASNTRVSTNSCASFAIVFPAAMFPLLFLHVSQIVVKTIETLRPKALVMSQPIGDVFQRRGGDPAGAPFGFSPSGKPTRGFP